MEWRTLSSLIGKGATFYYRRYMRLQQAYEAVFTGSPSSEDQELVLIDLLQQSGFNRFSGPDTPNDHLRYQEGMRALYGHIFNFLSLSDDDTRALENAARTEAALHEDMRNA